MKQSEKTLVGLMFLVGGAAIVGLVGLPQWDTFSNNQSQATALNDEVKALESQKTTLTAEIAQLEKNSVLPPDIEVQIYTEKNREQIIKGMLDRVVNLATGAGNLFISLAPSDATSTTAPPPDANKDAKAAATTPATTDDAAQSGTPPILNQFNYQLAVRGTYTSVQNFLRTMAKQKSLMEIATMRLENEQGNTTPSPDNPSDPFHPIKMTATIRLSLQPANQ